jgi:hypothetical protein
MFSPLAAAASSATVHANNALVAVCPVAPPGAQAQIDKLMGYVLWGVLISFGIGLVVSLGAVAGGKIVRMPHASQAGAVGIVIMFVAAIGYVVLPPILKAMTGTGCI